MDLFEFDAGFAKHLLCGVDEAGRGPLAGPVCAAAVILKADSRIEGVNDSKKLSEKRREVLYGEIVENAFAYGIGFASVEEIEAINILNAAMLAMRRAVEAMGITPELVLVDGNKLPDLAYPSQYVIGGDARSACIAAASILAKVTRDRLMLDYAKEYPQYCFEKHKGYGTKLHYEALLKYGPSPIHRLSFLKKWAERNG